MRTETSANPTLSPLQTRSAHLYIKYSMEAGSTSPFKSLVPDAEEACPKTCGVNTLLLTLLSPRRVPLAGPERQPPSGPSSQPQNTPPSPASPPVSGQVPPGPGQTPRPPPCPPCTTARGLPALLILSPESVNRVKCLEQRLGKGTTP